METPYVNHTESSCFWIHLFCLILKIRGKLSSRRLNVGVSKYEKKKEKKKTDVLSKRNPGVDVGVECLPDRAWVLLPLEAMVDAVIEALPTEASFA